MSLFQSESKYKTILLKMTLICMKMKLHAEAQENSEMVHSTLECKNHNLFETKMTKMEKKINFFC